MLSSNQLQEQLLARAALVAGDLSLELVELAVRRGGSRYMLRIDIDRAGPHGVTLDDCQRFSRALEAAIDEGELITSNYVLEVSSPGIDRPIVTPDDIRRNTGRRVSVTTRDARGVEHTACGILLGQEDGHVRLSDGSSTDVRIPWADVVRAQQTVEL